MSDRYEQFFFVHNSPRRQNHGRPDPVPKGPREALPTVVINTKRMHHDGGGGGGGRVIAPVFHAADSLQRAPTFNVKLSL